MQRHIIKYERILVRTPVMSALFKIHWRDKTIKCRTFAPQPTSKSCFFSSNIRPYWKSLTSIYVIQSPCMNFSLSSGFQEVFGSLSLRSDLDRLELRVGSLGGVDMRICTAPRDGPVSDKLYWATGKRIAQTNPNQKTYHVNYIPKQVRLQRLGACM